MLEVIILAGGLGTRLASAVPHLPKILAPIQKTPFLHILLTQLAKANIISKAILALRHRADEILQALSIPLPFPIEASFESHALGTGGAVLQALSKTSQEDILVINGDTFFDLSFSTLHAFHVEKKATITVATRQVPDRSRYGSIEIDSSSKIISYQEKATHSGKGLISAGIYLIQKKILLDLSIKESSLETDFFPLFIQKGAFSYLHSGVFIDIGTPESYEEAQTILQPWIPT